VREDESSATCSVLPTRANEAMFLTWSIARSVTISAHGRLPSVPSLKVAWSVFDRAFSIKANCRSNTNVPSASTKNAPPSESATSLISLAAFVARVVACIVIRPEVDRPARLPCCGRCRGSGGCVGLTSRRHRPGLWAVSIEGG
jgi:hypothetical protein